MPPILARFEELNGTQKFNENCNLSVKSNLQSILRGSFKRYKYRSETCCMILIQLYPMVGHLNAIM